MYVLSELKKSVDNFDKLSKELDKIDNFNDLDAYETKLQKVVFNLQMQANQVAGEIAPLIAKKRTSIHTTGTNDLMERVRAIKAARKEKENATTNNIDSIGDKPDSTSEELENGAPTTAGNQEHMDGDIPTERPESDLPVQELPKEENNEEVKDGGNDNRQSKSDSGNSKPKSSKKAK